MRTFASWKSKRSHLCPSFRGSIADLRRLDECWLLDGAVPTFPRRDLSPPAETYPPYTSPLMEDSKRATIYFDAAIHQALRLKAAATDRSISEMVNDAVKSALTEDAEDLAAFDERKSERSASFESLVRDLRKRGRI
jgi:hypothetical protein